MRKKFHFNNTRSFVADTGALQLAEAESHSRRWPQLDLDAGQHNPGSPGSRRGRSSANDTALFLRMRVRCRRVFMSLFAVLVSRICVMGSVRVLAARVMMLGLMMVMGCRMVMGGGRVMMLLRGVLR